MEDQKFNWSCKATWKKSAKNTGFLKKGKQCQKWPKKAAIYLKIELDVFLVIKRLNKKVRR